jgi:GH25 family lysozyme M1 (1,4-beta-N-acetylmuramidase)
MFICKFGVTGYEREDTMKIIDISAWQDPAKINYEKIAEQVNGVILRGAYGIWKDTRFAQHYATFKRLGVPLGIYHYLVEYKSALEQAGIFYNIISGEGVIDDFKLGVWCDVELELGAIPLTRKTVDTYINSLQGRGLSDIGMYSSRYYWDSIMKTDYYKNQKLWIANYSATSPALPATGGWTKWWLWQYTKYGVLDGYAGGLDTNHFWGTPADYNAWVGKVVVDPAEPRVPLYTVECIATVMMNIRQQPFVANNIVGTLKNGEKRDVYAESNGWLNIKEGWISAAYTIRVTDIPEPPVVISDAEKLERLWSAHMELH